MDYQQTINQISRNTRMCVGASDYVAVSDNTLRFRVRISNQRNYIYITLNGRDLYDVRQTLVRGMDEFEKFEANDVYCDQLDEVIYRMGSTRHASEAWLAEVGIQAAA